MPVLPTVLLSFAEAAAYLSTSTDKVRRLVVEDRLIEAIRVNAKGDRTAVDLESLGTGEWRIDDHGQLCLPAPVFEKHKIVGISHYEPQDVGVLRIEQGELDHYRISHVLPVAVATVASTTHAPAIAITSQDAVGLALPAGLDSPTIASVFDGIWGSSTQWEHRFKGPSKWLNSPPILMRRGHRGKDSSGRYTTSLRNPVELAKVLIAKKGCKTSALTDIFVKSNELSAWTAIWEAYREDASEFTSDWGR